LTRKAGVEVRHALRRSLIVIAGASYSVANYSGIDVSEHEFKSKLGAELYLSRETAITAGYEHTVYDTDGTARDYVDDTYRVGVRIRR
jgi:hypothetical protein